MDPYDAGLTKGVRFDECDRIIEDKSQFKWFNACYGHYVDEVNLKDRQWIMYDGEWIEQTLDGRVCKDGDNVWVCQTNYSIGEGYEYYSVDGECWDLEGYWFNCAQRACDWFGYDWACDEARGGRARDKLEDVADALEDWAEDILDANSDLIDEITSSTQELIANVGLNVTAGLNQTVSDAFEQLQNQTSAALNETRA